MSGKQDREAIQSVKRERETERERVWLIYICHALLRQMPVQLSWLQKLCKEEVVEGSSLNHNLIPPVLLFSDYIKTYTYEHTQTKTHTHIPFKFLREE